MLTELRSKKKQKKVKKAKCALQKNINLQSTKKDDFSMISAEIIIDERRITKKGYPLKIRIYDSLEKGKSPHKYLPLKVYQKDAEIKLDSNLKRRSLELESEVEYCNKNHLRLNDALNVIKNGIPIDDIENEIKLLEFKLQQLYSKRNKDNGKGFISFIDDLIKERSIEKKDIKAYKSIKSILTKIILPLEDIPINSIDKEYLKSIELILRGRGVVSNTVKTYFTLMKVIFDESKTRKSLRINDSNPFYEIKVLDKEKKIYNITEEDLVKILNLELENIDVKGMITTTKEDLIRDSEIFLFQICIGGHDFIDIANLKWSNIIGGRLIFKRTKNRNKVSPIDVDVFLSKYALSIIEKHGDKKSERIFSHIPNPEIDYYKYSNFIVMLNKVRFKRITNSVGINVELKTKAPRYIFRTLAGNLLVNDFIIMKIQGHKPQGITFGYQGVLNYEVQDKEHKKILDLIFKD